jgi:RHS repeat-associated protein
VRFTYDALGRRVSKRSGGEATEYVWDGDDLVHERRRNADSSLQPLITWIFEPGSFAPAAKFEGYNRYSVITDHLGTPTILLTEAGQLAWKAQIDIWGTVREETHAGPDENQTDNPWRWPGQHEDAETGLYYNRFRNYDPETGRYISQDPAGLCGGLSQYGYVDDPLGWIDPLGLTGKCSTKRKNSLNSNSAVSNFGIYEIIINAELHKVGKADLNRVTKSSGLPTRLHQQLRKIEKELEKVFGKGNVAVKGKVMEDLGETTTTLAKTAETARLQDIYNKTGKVPAGNIRSFKPSVNS